MALRETVEYALRLTGDIAERSKETASGITDIKSAAAAGLTAVGALSAAALTAGAAFGKLASDVFGTVDQMNTLAQASGLSTDMVGGLRLAAANANKSLDQLVPRELPAHMLEAANGSKEAASAFQRLGVDVVDTRGHLRTSDEVLGDLVSALYRVEDPALRAGLAAKTMGEQGRQMLSAFADSRDLERFVGVAREFGIHARIASEQSDKWWRATANLKLAVEDTGAAIVSAYGDQAAGLLDNLALGTIYLSTLLAGVADVMFTVRDKVIANAASLMNAVRDAIAGKPIVLNITTPTDLKEIASAGLEAASREALDRAEEFWKGLQNVASTPPGGDDGGGGDGLGDQTFAVKAKVDGILPLTIEIHALQSRLETWTPEFAKQTDALSRHFQAIEKQIATEEKLRKANEDLETAVRAAQAGTSGLGFDAGTLQISDALQSFSGGVSGVLSSAIGGPVGAAVGALSGVFLQLPQAVNQLSSQVLGLVNGIPETVSGLLTQLPAVLTSVIPQAIAGIATMVPKLAEAVISAAPQIAISLVAMAPRIGLAIAGSMIDILGRLFSPQYWIGIGNAFVQGIRAEFNRFIEDLSNVLNVFKDRQGRFLGVNLRRDDTPNSIFGVRIGGRPDTRGDDPVRGPTGAPPSGQNSRSANSGRGHTFNVTVVANDGRTVARSMRDLLGTYGLNDNLDPYGV